MIFRSFFYGVPAEIRFILWLELIVRRQAVRYYLLPFATAASAKGFRFHPSRGHRLFSGAISGKCSLGQ